MSSVPAPHPGLHRIPRHPHAWIWVLAASQLLVVALWWRLGWKIGLPAMLATHLPFWWGVLWPGARLFGPVLTRLPIADKRVWLTIDDGPSAETMQVLDLLDAHGARATFFLVGERAAARPDEVREIVRRGHGVGNHSATHPTKWFWALPPRRMRDEVSRTQAILRGITGQAPRWFRAVVGMANPFVPAALAREGLACVAWSARGFDGAFGNPKLVVGRVRRKLRPGAIVLAHEGAAHGGNLETMAALLAMLDEQGYATVLPEDL